MVKHRCARIGEASSHILSYAICFCIAIVALIAPALAGPQCMEDSRPIKFQDGSGKVRSFVCRLTDADKKATLRVEFDRLSEAAVGSLLFGIKSPELQKAIGRPKVIPNEVQKEAKAIFEKFGRRETMESCYEFALEAAKGGKDYEQKRDGCDGRRTLYYLTFPDRLNGTTLGIAMPAAQKVFRREDRWPPGFSFFYNADCKSPDFIPCTQLWRTATSADIAGYGDNVKSYTKIVVPSDDGRGGSPKKYLSLAEGLMANHWYDDFFIITSSYDECGDLQFDLHLRPLMLDVMIVENLSDAPILLEGYFGQAESNKELRVEANLAASGSESLSLPAVKVGVGEKIALPLKLSFRPGDDLEIFKDLEGAKKSYARITGAPAGTVFKADNGKIKKVRESFQPPSAPPIRSFVYGPAFDIRGLTIDGKKVELADNSKNFLMVTAGDGYGSCPFAYVWDDKLREWVLLGKVLDKANEQSKQRTEQIRVSGLKLRYRLSEEELEVSYIDAVRLRLSFKNGRQLIIPAADVSLAQRDHRYSRLVAGEAVDVEFEIPKYIKARDVRASTLIVDGYYRRYSSLLALQ